MCFPVALGGIAGAISAAASVAGTAMSVVGAMQSANAQAASYQAQAEYAKRQALMEQQKGAYESQRLNDQTTRQIDAMRGQYLSSGIALSGSALDVLADSATEASLDEQAIKYGARVKADNYTFESQMATMNAKQAKQAGTIGAISAGIGGLSNLAGQMQNRTMLTNPYVRQRQNSMGLPY